MRVRHLSLANFRGFAALELDFDARLTVLVGVNGSGKSTVLDAVALALRGVTEGSEAVLEAGGGVLRNGAGAGNVELTHDAPLPKLTLGLTPGGAIFGGFRGSLITAPNGSVPILALYPVARTATDRTPGSTTPNAWAPTRAWETAFEASADFDALFSWFRERQDLENEERVQEGAGTDPRLDAVRVAVERVMPGFTNLRVRRPRQTPDEHFALRKPTLGADKAGTYFAFDQLSEGERSLIAMVADIARRLSIANVTGDPLEGRGIVMIDEIELHLHPKWQVEVLERLLGVFPNLQFIVTTHSPLVLSRVEAERIRLLHEFQVYRPPHPVAGRDAGSILSDVFETDPLPGETRDAVARISALIDADRFDDARVELATLATKLGDLDLEVTRLRTAIDLLAS